MSCPFDGASTARTTLVLRWPRKKERMRDRAGPHPEVARRGGTSKPAGFINLTINYQGINGRLTARRWHYPRGQHGGPGAGNPCVTLGFDNDPEGRRTRGRRGQLRARDRRGGGWTCASGCAPCLHRALCPDGFSGRLGVAGGARGTRDGALMAPNGGSVTASTHSRLRASDGPPDYRSSVIWPTSWP